MTVWVVPEEADGLFRKSIALVDTMIRRASTLSVERQLLAEMSDIYSAYFAYLSDKNRYEAALQVLENVRGRLESEALEHHSSQPLHQPTPQEQELTRLNIALINTDDPTNAGCSPGSDLPNRDQSRAEQAGDRVH